MMLWMLSHREDVSRSRRGGKWIQPICTRLFDASVGSTKETAKFALQSLRLRRFPVLFIEVG